MRVLLQAGASHAPTFNNALPLHAAGQVPFFTSVAQLWINNNSSGMCGSVDIVTMLLSSSSSSSSSMVHCVDESGLTPLHIAAIYGNVDCARTLLAAGADMETQDEDCQSPLYLALSFGHAEVVGLLLERGANMSLRDKYGTSGGH